MKNKIKKIKREDRRGEGRKRTRGRKGKESKGGNREVGDRGEHIDGSTNGILHLDRESETSESINPASASEYLLRASLHPGSPENVAVVVV